MLKRIWIAFSVLACGSSLATPVTAAGPAVQTQEAGDSKPSRDQEPPGEDVFGLTRVWKIHLEISPEEWKKMQPVGGMPFPGGPGGPGAPGGPQAPGDERGQARPGQAGAETHKGGFGMEFPWARGELTAEGRTYRNVGLRCKGNFTYLAASGGLKWPLKIDFDRYDEAQAFHGLKKINLNNGVTDPARARESLSFAVFRAAGVPAPRTAYAEVTLTVPGRYDREYLGLYTLVEQVDKPFLKAHFKNGKGLLLKPEGIRGLEYLGDTWPPYEQRYQPKDDATSAEQQRLIAFVRLVNQADDEQFHKEIGSFLDVDRFLRFLAVNALLANLDSFLAFGHNYYLYLRPDTNQFVFIPWDVDLSVGTWPMGGTPEQQMDLSISHPHAGENKLIDRLLAMDDVREKYLDLLKELTATCFAREQWLADLARIGQVTTEPLDREVKAAKARGEGAGVFGFGPPGPPEAGVFGGMSGGADFLRTFIEKRTESVAAQLAGRKDGYVPMMGFGFPGGGPGGPPGGFGPGGLLAAEIMKRGDLDKDGTLTRDELAAAVQAMLSDSDQDKNGSLDAKELAEAINQLFPPPDFGPGGPAGPGGPGGIRPDGPGPGEPRMPGAR